MEHGKKVGLKEKREIIGRYKKLMTEWNKKVLTVALHMRINRAVQ